MCRFSSVSLAVLVFGLFSVFAVAAGNRPSVDGAIPIEQIVAPRIHKENNDRDQRFPPTDTVESSGTVENLYGKFYFSNAIELKDPQWVVGEDPILAEVSLMNTLLDRVESGEIPPDEAHLILTRYHLADERVYQSLARAVNLGIQVDVITDLNDSVTAKFKEGEKSIPYSPDAEIIPNESPAGKMLKKLLDLGFKPGTERKKPQLGLYSQQIFNKEADKAASEEGSIRMYDIMHEKSVVAAWVKEEKIVWVEVSAGSANMVAHQVSESLANEPIIVTRVNIVRQILDRGMAERRYEHALNLRDTFSQSGNISDLKTENFYRVNASNGWVETAVTNGRYNLNDRIAALTLHAVPGMTKDDVARAFDRGVESYYERIAPEFAGWKISEIRESQFVWTHSHGREAEKLLFEGDPDVKKFGIYDAKFNEVAGWGYPPVQSAGVDLLRRFGGTIFAWKKSIASRIKSLIYLRRLDGVPETDLEGPPLSRFLLHTKLYMVRGILKDGTKVTVIFDGSLNRSNHKENAEDQDMIVIKGKSKLADSYWSLPELLVQAEPQYFSGVHVALVGDTLARLAGKSPLEVPAGFSEKVSELIALGKTDEAIEEIGNLARVETELVEQPGLRVVNARIRRFRDFLLWHKTNFPWNYGEPDNFYLHKLLDVAAILSNPSISNGQAAYFLQGMMFSRDSTKESQEVLAREAWKILGMKEPFPEPRAVKESSPSIEALPSAKACADEISKLAGKKSKKSS